jgi:hypothetical protein
MNAENLAQLLCRDFVHSVGTRHERSFIVTNFRYPDGDFVLLYVQPDGDQCIITDLGTTLFKCTVARVILTDTRKNLLNVICRKYGIEQDHGALRKVINVKSVGADTLAFCEAVTRISNLQMETDSGSRSVIPAQIERLLEQRVTPQRQFVRKWSHPDLDTSGDYPVDYRLNGVGEARNVFIVGSPAKSTFVAAASSFFRLNAIYVPTLAIIDPEVHFGRHYISRLQRAATEIRYGVTGYEEQIVRFALSGMEVSPIGADSAL